MFTGVHLDTLNYPHHVQLPEACKPT